MKEKYNLKSIITGLVVLLSGILLVIADLSWLHLNSAWGLSIGSSLIASAIVILFTAIFVEKRVFSPLDEWKIDRIFATRSEKNSESDSELDNARYRIDIIAFGLGSFRSSHDKRVEACLRKGVNFRIITMDPNSPYALQRAREEEEVEDQIKVSIEHLVAWANKKNQLNCKGRIIIKGYSSMTLDYYWRVDDVVCVGPYWYGVDSQQTITYKFLEGGKGFSQYADYFDQLWENESLCRVLTDEKEIPKRRRAWSK